MNTTSAAGVVIVGAGQAGGDLTGALRAGGYAGNITLIGDEPYAPYRRPPLSKAFLSGEASLESLYLKSTETYARQQIMGCYGIGVERILTSAIESSAAKFAAYPDAKGEQYALSPAIAPFEVVVSVTNVREQELVDAGEKVAMALEAAGLDVLLDDRDERAGVKFKDAELIGVPYRVNIGKKLAEGQVELVDRLSGATTDMPIDAVAGHLQALVSSFKA